MLLCCIYRLPSSSMLLCFVYCPPSSLYEFFDHMSAECEMALKFPSQHLSIVGDLNCDILLSSSSIHRRLSSFCKQFVDFSDLVDAATRIETSAFQLDVLLLTNAASCFNDTLVHPFCRSDQHLITSVMNPRGNRAALAPPLFVCRVALYVDRILEVLDKDDWKWIVNFD